MTTPGCLYARVSKWTTKLSCRHHVVSQARNVVGALQKYRDQSITLAVRASHQGTSTCACCRRARSELLHPNASTALPQTPASSASPLPVADPRPPIDILLDRTRVSRGLHESAYVDSTDPALSGTRAFSSRARGRCAVPRWSGGSRAGSRTEDPSRSFGEQRIPPVACQGHRMLPRARSTSIGNGCAIATLVAICCRTNVFACYGTLTNASICSDMRLYVRNSLADSRGNVWSSLLEHDGEFLLPAIGVETRAEDNRAQPGARNTGDSTVLCRLRMNCCIHNNCLLQNAMLGLRKSGVMRKQRFLIRSDSTGVGHIGRFR